MFIVGQLLLGLVWIHIFWVYFFITGTLVRTKQQPAHDLDDPQRTGPVGMADLVITTVTGIAITGFVLLLFGFLGLLSAGAFLLWLIIEGLLFKVLRDENIFAAEFWLAKYDLFKRSWSLPAVIIYCLFVIISVPAILPPTLWDSTMYHLAYAVDWTNAGQIYVDEFLRFPYFANNFLVLDSLLFALRLGYVCHFLTWFCGLLTGLGVYSMIAQARVTSPESNIGSGRQISLPAVIIPIGLALSPVVLHFLNSGYVDVPIGLFLFTAILCAYLGLRDGGQKYQLEFVLIAAFCVGMKITLILSLPFFMISLALLIKKSGQPISRLLVLTTLLLVLSAPWYVRNFISTGDPIAPTLNMLFKRSDPIWSYTDYAAQLADIRTDKDPLSLLRLPIDLFWNTPSPKFRESGTSPMVVLLYVPFIMPMLLLFRRVRRRFGWSFVYLNVALIYFLTCWIGISSWARYFLHAFPLYAAYIGVWFCTLLPASLTNWSSSRARYGSNVVVTVSLIFLMLFPTAPVRSFYEDLVQNDYLQLASRFPSYRGFLRRNLTGYASTQYIVNSLQSNGNQDEKVLLVGFENLNYYFRRNHIVSFGDWFGPGRHRELLWSVDFNELTSYLARFDVRAVLVNLGDKRMDDGTYLHFTKQLEENHFVLQPTQEAATAIYIQTR